MYVKSTRKIRASHSNDHRAAASLGQLCLKKSLGHRSRQSRSPLPPRNHHGVRAEVVGAAAAEEKSHLYTGVEAISHGGEVSTNVQAREAMVFVRFLIKTIAKEPAQRKLKQQSGGFCAFPFK